MPKKPHHTYFYRAFFKPKSLDVFENFATGVDDQGRGLGYTQAWHRSNWSGSLYAVYNEFICGEIGRFLRLPVPPFAITYGDSTSDSQALFSSLDFNFSRAGLPRVLPDLCVEALPALSAGVLAFDILIANEDRHDENLLVDRVLKPRLMHVFDHDQALLGGCQAVGLERFEKLRNRLGITGGPVTGGNPHIFLRLIKTCKHLTRWADRIRQIPDWFIDAVCTEAKNFGLEKSLSRGRGPFLAP